MQADEGAFLIAVLAFFLVVALYARQIRLEADVTEMKKAQRAESADAQGEATITVTHHHGAGDKKGFFLLQNTGRGPASDITLEIRRNDAEPGAPLIPEGTARVQQLIPGARATVDTTTAHAATWPVELLVTWTDRRGHQSTLLPVTR